MITTVYTINAQTNTVDEWLCTGEMTAKYNGKMERLCFLQKERKSLALPKRCVFETKDAALAVLNHN